MLTIADKVSTNCSKFLFMIFFIYCKGSFHNYVDQILPNFDSLEWTIVDILPYTYPSSQDQGTIHILRMHIFRVLGPLPPCKHVFSTENKQKLAFSEPPPPYNCLRNIWMVPKCGLYTDTLPPFCCPRSYRMTPKHLVINFNDQ